jgi:RNA polymerase sporulation-specific sigma factor
VNQNELIEKHRKMVTIIARKFVGGNLTEQDLVQEGMISLLRAHDTFNVDGGASFETYATRVIRNRLIDIIRRQKGRGFVDYSGDLSDIVAERKYDPQVEEEFLEKSSLIKKILAQLPDVERAIFNSYAQGYSYDEIVKIFDISKKKIDNTVQKVRKLVRESF